MSDLVTVIQPHENNHSVDPLSETFGAKVRMERVTLSTVTQTSALPIIIIINNNFFHQPNFVTTATLIRTLSQNIYRLLNV